MRVVERVTGRRGWAFRMVVPFVCRGRRHDPARTVGRIWLVCRAGEGWEQMAEEKVAARFRKLGRNEE